VQRFLREGAARGRGEGEGREREKEIGSGRIGDPRKQEEDPKEIQRARMPREHEGGKKRKKKEKKERGRITISNVIPSERVAGARFRLTVGERRRKITPAREGRRASPGSRRPLPPTLPPSAREVIARESSAKLIARLMRRPDRNPQPARKRNGRGGRRGRGEGAGELESNVYVGYICTPQSILRDIRRKTDNRLGLVE